MTPVFGMEYFILEQGHRVNRPNWNIYGILMYIIYIYFFNELQVSRGWGTQFVAGQLPINFSHAWMVLPVQQQTSLKPWNILESQRFKKW